MYKIAKVALIEYKEKVLHPKEKYFRQRKGRWKGFKIKNELNATGYINFIGSKIERRSVCEELKNFRLKKETNLLDRFEM